MDGGFPYLGEWAGRLCKGCWIKTGCERLERSHLEGGLWGKESKAEGTWKFLSFRDDKKLTCQELYMQLSRSRAGL